jgi:hypothetical protein
MGDDHLLQDARANFGFMYGGHLPARVAIGPTVLAVAGYDSRANNHFAFGIGPSILSRVWMGGDRYRSYDAILSMQLGYLFPVGYDERQRGWRGQVGITF